MFNAVRLIVSEIYCIAFVIRKVLFSCDNKYQSPQVDLPDCALDLGFSANGRIRRVSGSLVASIGALRQGTAMIPGGPFAERGRSGVYRAHAPRIPNHQATHIRSPHHPGRPHRTPQRVLLPGDLLPGQLRVCPCSISLSCLCRVLSVFGLPSGGHSGKLAPALVAG